MNNDSRTVAWFVAGVMCSAAIGGFAGSWIAMTNCEGSNKQDLAEVMIPDGAMGYDERCSGLAIFYDRGKRIECITDEAVPFEPEDGQLVGPKDLPPYTTEAFPFHDGLIGQQIYLTDPPQGGLQ